MKAKELIEKYRACGEQDLPVLLHFLADHWHSMRLADGQSLNDNMDSAAALRELAEAARTPETGWRGTGIRIGRNESHCHRCGHVHLEDDECGFPIGGGRVCRCEEEVAA